MAVAWAAVEAATDVMGGEEPAAAEEEVAAPVGVASVVVEQEEVGMAVVASAEEATVWAAEVLEVAVSAAEAPEGEELVAVVMAAVALAAAELAEAGKAVVAMVLGAMVMVVMLVAVAVTAVHWEAWQAAHVAVEVMATEAMATATREVVGKGEAAQAEVATAVEGWVVVLRAATRAAARAGARVGATVEAVMVMVVQVTAAMEMVRLVYQERRHLQQSQDRRDQRRDQRIRSPAGLHPSTGDSQRHSTLAQPRCHHLRWNDLHTCRTHLRTPAAKARCCTPCNRSTRQRTESTQKPRSRHHLGYSAPPASRLACTRSQSSATSLGVRVAAGKARRQRIGCADRPAERWLCICCAE